MARDLALRDALAEFPALSWSGTTFRAVWESRDALQGSTGGGRWCPPNSFEVLYMSLDESGAIAEIDAWLSEMTPRPDQPILIHEVHVELRNSITIASLDELAKLGVDTTRYDDRFYQRTQEIGDAVNFLGFDGLFIPSARWPCMNLVLFLGNHRDDQHIEVTNSQPVDWNDWNSRQTG